VQKQPISLVIISFNEASNIERCIRSVPWSDEVIVLDSGSTDGTVELAQNCGAKVYIEKWRGYRDQKARATELAKNDWILSLDADEALSSEASIELQRLLKERLLTTTDVDGVELSRISYHLRRWIRHGGWYPDWQLRLFNRKTARWSAGHVHERIQATKVLRVRASIQHWPFPTLAEQVQTNNNYSSLGAQDLFDKGKKFSLLKLVFKPISKFLETYVIKGGFRDGLPGFIIAVGAAYSVFLKFAKLKELQPSSESKQRP
jgi:glycosyltransferase involved in cell wall biosynthesis